MIGRQSSLARKFQAIGIVSDRRTGQLFRVVLGLKLRRAEHPPHRPDSVNNDPLVVFVHQVVGLNNRSAKGIGRAGSDEPGALRSQLIETELNNGESFGWGVGIISERDIELDIGSRAKVL